MRSSKQPRLRKKARIDILLFVSFTCSALVWFGGNLALDSRSLAVARVLLGALVFIDLCTSRWPLRHTFYSDGMLSVWPRQVVLEGGDPQIQSTDLSIYMLSGSIQWTCLCFIVSGIASIMLSLGVFSHFACFICWVHMTGLSKRTSAVQQAGDTLLRILLFWFMWLPCQQHYSLHTKLESLCGIPVTSLTPETMRVSSVATLGLMVQISLLYLLPAAFKVNPLWRTPTCEHSAIYYVLSNVAFCRKNFLTTWLLHHRAVMMHITAVTPWLEYTAPIFVFGNGIPGLRLLGVALLLGFHLGLHVCMTLRLFPWICMCAWVALIPSECWDITLPCSGIQQTTFQDNYFSLAVGMLGLACTVHACLDTLPLPQTLAKAVSKSAVGSFLVLCGRFLGLNQQWFLFDNPARTSYWYRIKGLCEKSEHDLLKLLRLHCDGSLSKLSPKALASSIEISDPESDDRDGKDFNKVYGGALWRKFLQNIGQRSPSCGHRDNVTSLSSSSSSQPSQASQIHACSEKVDSRYSAFLPHYANVLNTLWIQGGLHRQIGELKEVRCIACWVDSSLQADTRSLNRAVMWKINTFVNTE